MPFEVDGPSFGRNLHGTGKRGLVQYREVPILADHTFPTSALSIAFTEYLPCIPILAVGSKCQRYWHLTDLRVPAHALWPFVSPCMHPLLPALANTPLFLKSDWLDPSDAPGVPDGPGPSY